MSVEQARDAAIVRICDCECTAEVQHASASCRTAGIGKIDALIAAVRAEERQSRQALVAALRIAAELLERNGIERPEITAVLAQGDK